MGSPRNKNKISQAFNAIQDQTGTLFTLMYLLIEDLYRQVEKANLADKEEIDKALGEIKRHEGNEERQKFKPFLKPPVPLNDRAIKLNSHFHNPITLDKQSRIPLFLVWRFDGLKKSPVSSIANTIGAVARIIQDSLHYRAHLTGRVASEALILFAAAILKLRSITPIKIISKEDLRLDDLWRSASCIFSSELGLQEIYLPDEADDEEQPGAPSQEEAANDNSILPDTEENRMQEAEPEESSASLGKIDAIEQICRSMENNDSISLSKLATIEQICRSMENEDSADLSNKLSSIERICRSIESSVSTLREMAASGSGLRDTNDNNSQRASFANANLSTSSEEEPDYGAPYDHGDEKLRGYQAQDALTQLRNDIRNETKVDHWENILQGPFIKEILKSKIVTMEAWQKNAVISPRYQQYKTVMDNQLKRFWNDQVQPILDQIDFGD